MKTDKRRIVYSGHLKLRMLLRGIPTEVPRIVYEDAERIFRNKLTGHRIAVGKVTMDGRERSLMVVYDIARNGSVVLITVHPISMEQAKRRIKSGRWREVKGEG